MVDVFDQKTRSRIMARVRGRGNKNTELALINVLRTYKVSGWRRRATIFGSPDFIFPRARVALFVDGCFWHSCPKHQSVPASNRAFWLRKLARNQRRDRLVTRTLRKSGWKVIRVWQHELTRVNELRLVSRLRRVLASAN
jgi:DNA mismatch endonuclease (patch repair protein)